MYNGLHVHYTSNLYRKMHSKGISMPPILELAINDIEENLAGIPKN